MRSSPSDSIEDYPPPSIIEREQEGEKSDCDRRAHSADVAKKQREEWKKILGASCLGMRMRNMRASETVDAYIVRQISLDKKISLYNTKKSCPHCERDKILCMRGDFFLFQTASLIRWTVFSLFLSSVQTSVSSVQTSFLIRLSMHIPYNWTLSAVQS